MKIVFAVAVVAMPADAAFRRKPRMAHVSMWTVLALAILMPAPPEPNPLMSRPRSVTSSVVAALIRIATLPGAPIPADPPSQEMVTAKVMVTGPNSPESWQLTSPPTVVWESAIANVRHGNAWVHGLLSSPDADTKVRDVAASAGPMKRAGHSRPTAASRNAILRMRCSSDPDQLARRLRIAPNPGRREQETRTCHDSREDCSWPPMFPRANRVGTSVGGALAPVPASGMLGRVPPVGRNR